MTKPTGGATTAKKIEESTKDKVAVQVSPNKIFAWVEPKQSDRPGARRFAVGDEWHNDDVVKVWNGTAWQAKEELFTDEK